MKYHNAFLGYLKYLYSSGTKYDIHPPFLFDLVTKVYEDKNTYSDYSRVEELKEELLKNDRKISVTDLGAGSVVSKGNQRSISKIAKYSSKPLKYGRLLYRLTNYFKPNTVLELGTSLGLSSAYMALGNPESRIITMEGCPNISSLAKENFENLNLINIKLVTGNFDDTLKDVLDSASELDFIFIDGNHREEPTIRYFEQCLTKTVNNSILIFDDIHWSKEMEAAWKYIKNHNLVTLTIDTYFMGFTFVNKDLSKQDFSLKF